MYFKNKETNIGTLLLSNKHLIQISLIISLNILHSKRKKQTQLNPESLVQVPIQDHTHHLLVKPLLFPLIWSRSLIFIIFHDLDIFVECPSLCDFSATVFLFLNFSCVFLSGLSRERGLWWAQRWVGSHSAHRLCAEFANKFLLSMRTHYSFFHECALWGSMFSNILVMKVCHFESVPFCWLNNYRDDVDYLKSHLFVLQL